MENNCDDCEPLGEAAEEPLINADERPLVLDSEEIMHGRREVWIRHGQTLYRLRRTSTGKLYLSK